MAVVDNTTNPSFRGALLATTAPRRRMLRLAVGTAAVVAGGPATATEAEPLESLWGDYLQACQRFCDACEAEEAAWAVEQARGVDALTERVDALCLEMDALAEHIIEAPTQTMRGVLVKLKLAVKLRGINEDDDEDGGAGRVIRRLIADIGRRA